MFSRFRTKWIPHPRRGCWIWIGGADKKGYGRIGDADGNTFVASRVSWELHNGQIPPGLWVLHKCDNGRCVNPEHLFLGTLQDNEKDKVAKGRQGFGEKNPGAKLTEKEVEEIRKAVGLLKNIAADFGVALSTVSQIRSGQRWRHSYDH
jgi:hypothetical protein